MNRYTPIARDGHFLRGGGKGGGLFGSKVKGRIKQMGAKTKTPQKSLGQKLTPKTPLPNFRALKISRKH